MNLIENIGFSAYTLADVLQGIDAVPEINVIQVPENLADQRLLYSPDLARLKSEGISFVVRSVFLQGLLLMSPNQIPTNLAVFQNFLEQLVSIAAEEECTVLELCLDYVSKISWASHILVGAVNSRQIEEILHSRSVLPQDWQERIVPITSNLVDPRNWNK
jgi:aryl-alcohol dehydrogenase-like predicted oxidoreductase